MGIILIEGDVKCELERLEEQPVKIYQESPAFMSATSKTKKKH